MPSRPFARLRRLRHRGASRPSRSAPLGFALTAMLAAMPAACSSTPSPSAAPREAPTRESAHGLSYTARSEIHFDGMLVGYLLEVQEVPEGIVDSRTYEPGTALIEDKDFEFIGFISPRGTTYRFDEDGVAKPVGFGSRDAGIAAFFKRNGKPQLVTPGFRS